MTPANAQRLGITLPESGVIPANQSVNFGFGKIDHEINDANRLSARYFLFKNFSESNIGGGLTTPDRATDFTDRMDSASAQLTSILGAVDVQRAAGAVRAAASVPHPLADRRSTARDHRHRHRAVRRATPRRLQLGRLRLQAGHLAGGRQRQLDSRPPQLQDRHRRAVGRRRSRQGRTLRVHVPDHRRLPRGRGRHRAARLHDVPAGLRQPDRELLLRRSTGSSCRTTGRSRRI